MSEDEEVPRLPIRPDDPPTPRDTGEAIVGLIHAITIGVHKLNALLDIEIQESQK